MRGPLQGMQEFFLGSLYSEFKTLEALSESFPQFHGFSVASRLNPMSPQHHGGSMIKFYWSLFGPDQAVRKASKLISKVEAGAFSDVNHLFGMENKKKRERTKIAPLKTKYQKNNELRRSIELGQHYPPIPNSEKVESHRRFKFFGCSSFPSVMTSEDLVHL